MGGDGEEWGRAETLGSSRVGAGSDTHVSGWSLLKALESKKDNLICRRRFKQIDIDKLNLSFQQESLVEVSRTRGNCLVSLENDRDRERDVSGSCVLAGKRVGSKYLVWKCQDERVRCTI